MAQIQKPKKKERKQEKKMNKKATAAGGNAALLLTRELTIRGLSPIFDPSYSCTWNYVDGKCVRNGPEPVVPPEALKADKEVKTWLGKALAAMQGVQKVT